MIPLEGFVGWEEVWDGVGAGEGVGAVGSIRAVVATGVVEVLCGIWPLL